MRSWRDVNKTKDRTERSLAAILRMVSDVESQSMLKGSCCVGGAVERVLLSVAFHLKNYKGMLLSFQRRCALRMISMIGTERC